jgi:hypothetical protein
VHGQVIDGANAIAGGWGPAPWPDAGETRPRALREVRLRREADPGPALAATTRRGAGRSRAKAGQSARPPDARGRTLDAWLRHLAKSLATVINLVDRTSSRRRRLADRGA